MFKGGDNSLQLRSICGLSVGAPPSRRDATELPMENHEVPSSDALPCCRPRLALAGGQGCIGRGGQGGGSERGGKGGLAGTPLLLGSPYGPRRRRAGNFEASVLLAPKAPKQNVGCQPQTLEGGGGGGYPPLLLRCTAVPTHPFWRNHHSNCNSSCVREDMLWTI